MVIARRHVFYVPGYDPQGAEGYYGIFERTAKRSLKVWPITLDLGKLELDSDLLAHWTIETSGSNWRVSTRYEFLRLEGAVRTNMSQPIWRLVPRALHWLVDDLLSGTTFRIFRAAWRFAVHLLYFQLMMLLWIAAAAGGGALVGTLATRFAGAPISIGIIVAVVTAVALFVLLRPVADRLHVVQINDCWPHMREFARGAPSSLNHPIDLFADRIVAAARANEADEILVIGHSGGGICAVAVMARALELDPSLGRHRAPVVLLTLGSIMPAAALHPAAEPLRAMVKRIAIEPSILWIDVRSRKDALNFWDFDPVQGIGIQVGESRRNPLLWDVRFRDMISPEPYRRMRTNFFRLHYQFIMANDKQAPYDYLMLTCGPIAVEAWATHRWDVLESFFKDGTYAAPQASERSDEIPSTIDRR